MKNTKSENVFLGIMDFHQVSNSQIIEVSKFSAENLTFHML